jgi:hypothetical protein
VPMRRIPPFLIGSHQLLIVIPAGVKIRREGADEKGKIDEEGPDEEGTRPRRAPPDGTCSRRGGTRREDFTRRGVAPTRRMHDVGN